MELACPQLAEEVEAAHQSLKDQITATGSYRYLETLEKCSILFKIKESENINPPDHHRDRHPYLVVFRGLIIERDAACPAKVFYDGGRLSKKGEIFKGLTMAFGKP